MVRGLWLVALAASCGCHALSGLDDYGIGAGEGGSIASIGGGGSGAIGGAASPGGGLAMGGGPSAGGATPSRPCVVSPTSDFEEGYGGGFSPTQTDTGIAVYAADSRLHVELPNGLVIGNGELHSTSAADFTDCGASVEVITRPPRDSSGWIALSLYFDADHGVTFVVDDVDISAATNDGEYVELIEASFDPSEHGWLRIEGVGGSELRWMVSPDGHDWTVFATAPAPFSLGELTIRVGAGGEVLQSDVHVELDNLNVLPDRP